jgi:hypothetical protein
MTNRMHERGPRDMARAEAEAGLKEFPPLARVVDEITARYPDAVPVALTQPAERARPAKAKSPARAADGREPWVLCRAPLHALRNGYLWV